MNESGTSWVEDARRRLRDERAPLAAVLLVTALAKAAALLPGYALDDWGNADGPIPILVDDVLHKGRLGHWLLLRAGMALQTEPLSARILYVTLSIAAYALFGWAVVRFWRVPPRGWLPVAAAVLVANHPYTVEIFTFRNGLPPAGIVLAILASLLHLAVRPAPRLLLGSLLFAAAASFYQIALHFALMVTLVGFAVRCARALGAPDPRPPDPGGATWMPSRLLADRDVRFLLYVVGGSLLYALAGRIVWGLMGVRESFFEMLSPRELPQRIAEVSRHVWATMAGTNPLLPTLVQRIFALVLLGIVCGLLWTVSTRSDKKSALARAIAIIALLPAAWLWSVGLFLVLRGYWPVARSMAHVGILWGGSLVIAALLLPWAVTRRALAVIAATIAVSFVGVSEQILDDQRRLNMRDMLLVDRMVARIETLPGLDQARRVIFAGHRPWHPSGPMQTQWGDLNLSALGAYWSNGALLREVSGHDLSSTKAPEDEAAAASYCAEHDPWPSPDAIGLQGQLIVICLSSP